MSEVARALAPGDVHVWRIALDAGGAARHAHDAALLTADERARAQRYRFERDRARYVAARAALRRLLASYVGIEPAALAFVADGSEGKPGLALPGAPAFNLAHSGDCALLAVAAMPRVGIDLEIERPIADVEVLASQYFTDAERDAVRTAGDAAQRAFLRVWTRKEAVLKAVGRGLTADLRTIEVGAGPAPQQVRFGGATLEVDALGGLPGHLAALALPWPRTLGVLSCLDDASHP